LSYRWLLGRKDLHPRLTTPSCQAAVESHEVPPQPPLLQTGQPQLLSRSSSDLFSRPLPSLAALLWTRSNPQWASCSEGPKNEHSTRGAASLVQSTGARCEGSTAPRRSPRPSASCHCSCSSFAALALVLTPASQCVEGCAADSPRKGVTGLCSITGCVRCCARAAAPGWVPDMGSVGLGRSGHSPRSRWTPGTGCSARLEPCSSLEVSAGLPFGAGLAAGFVASCPFWGWQHLLLFSAAHVPGNAAPAAAT